MKKALVVLACLFAASSAWAGTAYYGGYSAETGVPFFAPLGDHQIGGGPMATNLSTAFNTIISTTGLGGAPTLDFARQANGGYNLVNNVGRIKGGFVLNDGNSVASITDGTGYVAIASWDVPATPMTQAWSASTAGLNARCFFNVDIDGGAGGIGAGAQLGVMGLEWNTTAGKWAISSDNAAYLGNQTPPFYAAQTYLDTPPAKWMQRFEKKYIVVDAVTHVCIKAEYSVDNGVTWQWFSGALHDTAVTQARSDGFIDLTAAGGAFGGADSGGNDYFAWSIRGNAAQNMQMLVVGGAGVPDVNTTQDADSDSTPNYAESPLGAFVLAPTVDDVTAETFAAPVATTLVAADGNVGTTLTYTIIAGPSHGTLSGTAPDLTYTPTGDFFGADTFTYKVNNGSLDSNIGTVTINVRRGTDSDGDNLSDMDEINIWHTDFGDPDTDGDSLPDGFEVALYPILDPLVPNLVSLPVMGGLGLGLVSLTIAGAGMMRIRKRK